MRTKKKWLSAVFILMLALSSSAEVPDWIPPKADGESPVWVSEKEAFVDGELRLEIFSEAAQATHRRKLRSIAKSLESQKLKAEDETECTVYSIVFHPAPDSELTLEALHARSVEIYNGQLTAIKHGFYNGFPAMLLELTVERTVKTSRTTSDLPPENIYFLYKHAEIKTNAGLLCLRSRRYPDLPALGARAIFFSRAEVSRENHFFVQGSEDDIFFERTDGTTSSPEFFGNRPISLLGVEAMLHELALQGE